jgi:hypothetical protein
VSSLLAWSWPSLWRRFLKASFAPGYDISYPCRCIIWNQGSYPARKMWTKQLHNQVQNFIPISNSIAMHNIPTPYALAGMWTQSSDPNAETLINSPRRQGTSKLTIIIKIAN